jgi:tRNA(Ser,Leu) C12 N-acetylase TAN1
MSHQFCVNYRHRNNDNIERNTLISAVVDVVNASSRHVVNLETPSHVIVVEVVGV